MKPRILLLNIKVSSINHVQLTWNIGSFVSDQVFFFEISVWKSFQRPQRLSPLRLCLSIISCCVLIVSILLLVLCSLFLEINIPDISIDWVLESKKAISIQVTKLSISSKFELLWTKFRISSMYNFDFATKIHGIDVYAKDVRISSTWALLKRSTCSTVLVTMNSLHISIPVGFYIPCSLYLSLIEVKEVLGPLFALMQSNLSLNLKVVYFELLAGHEPIFWAKDVRLTLIKMILSHSSKPPLSVSANVSSWKVLALSME